MHRAEPLNHKQNKSSKCWDKRPDRITFKMLIHSNASRYLLYVNSWPTSAADHCDRLMSWRVPQEEHERVSETGVFPSLDRVSGTLPVTLRDRDISLVQFKRLLKTLWFVYRVATHSDCCFFAPCINTLTYLLIYYRATVFEVAWPYNQF